MHKDRFEIAHLDHVALIVENLETSIDWYKNVLGLKPYKLPKWGAYPIFMLSGKSGIALFPKKKESIDKRKTIDHFAFNVTNQNFERAQKRLNRFDIKFEFKDHHYFHSIYFKDPDNHTVELTTIVVDEDSFYN